MDKEIEIPFGAFDSELGGFEYTIPDGYEAEIKDGKVIVKMAENEDEKIRAALIKLVKKAGEGYENVSEGVSIQKAIAWLEKQGKQKSVSNLLNLWHNKSEKYDGKDTIILYHSTYDDAWHLVSSYNINWNNVDKWILLSDILTIEQKPVELEKEEKTRLMKKCVHKAYQRGYNTGFSMATNEMNHKQKIQQHLLEEKPIFPKSWDYDNGQENKELLLKDLCTRLPYGVICRTQKEYTSDSDFVDKEPIKGILIDICYDVEKVTLKHISPTVRHNYDFSVEEIRPYLRPMSSMTEEEKRDFPFPYYFEWIDNNFSLLGSNDEVSASIGFDEMYEIIDWLNAHHFDYRGLIEKGFALQAPEGMYNIKEE